jgi:hypothetical protein
VRLLATLVVLVGLAGPAAAVTPPPRAEGETVVELWTIDLGVEVWSIFGHGALCVFDQRDPDGRCYNYGTGRFDDVPKLVIDFLRRRAIFWVSTQSVERLIEYYQDEDRAIWRQRLPLTPEQAQRLADRLDEDLADEEKSHYAYDHRDDNCTTRLRDHIDAASGGALRRGADVPYGPSWHDLLSTGLANDVRLSVLGELFLARASAQRPTLWQAMYHPMIFRDAVAARFGVEPELVYQRRGPPVGGSRRAGQGWLGLYALALAALTGLTIAIGQWLGSRGLERLGLVILGLTMGLVACVVWAMMLISLVPDLGWNETALLLLPTDLALVGLRGRWLRGYLTWRVLGVIAVGAAAAAGLLVQPLGTMVLATFLPLACARLGLWRAPREDHD